MEEKRKYDTLLAEYRLLWNNRLLTRNEFGSEEVLKEAIRRDLLDENSHPRIRKNKFEKFYSAISRVLNSKSSTEIKLQLIELHNQIMKDLYEERN